MRRLTYLTALLWALLPMYAQAQGNDILWAADWGHGHIAIGGNYDSLFLLSGGTDTTQSAAYIPGTITQLRWHPKEPVLAISTQGEGMGLGLYYLQSQSLQRLPGVSANGVRGIGWSPDGELLAVGDNEGLLHIYHRSGKHHKTVDTGLRSITGLSWHPTKSLIAMVSGKIALYDLDREELRHIESRKEEVLILSVAWHPSGKFFATGDYGDYSYQYPALLQFWSEDGQKLKEMTGSKAEYRNLAWNKEGSVLATASDALRLWSDEGSLLKEQTTAQLLWGLSWSANEQQLVTTDIIGNVLLWSNDLTEATGLRY